MAQLRQIREAAREYVDDYADYDEMYEYHQALEADETFGTIAHCLQQVDLQLDQRGELMVSTQRPLAAARDDLETALQRRAATVEIETLIEEADDD